VEEKMKSKKLLFVTVILVAALLATAIPALATPPTPYSIYGTVLNNGANVAAGTEISAWINGVKYAYSPAFISSGVSYYTLDVPGDDTSTPGVIEGGKDGDLVYFKIGGQWAAEHGVWHSVTSVEILNLTVSPTAVEMTQLNAGVANPKNGLLLIPVALALGLGGFWVYRRRANRI
jgi:hypothetical protein